MRALNGFGWRGKRGEKRQDSPGNSCQGNPQGSGEASESPALSCGIHKGQRRLRSSGLRMVPQETQVYLQRVVRHMKRYGFMMGRTPWQWCLLADFSSAESARPLL